MARAQERGSRPLWPLVALPSFVQTISYQVRETQIVNQNSSSAGAGHSSRRDFIKTTAVTAAALAAYGRLASDPSAQVLAPSGADPFALELATEDFTGYVGACTVGFSCVYANTICWSSPTTPLPMEINPRVVFERLFGEPGTADQRRASRQRDLKPVRVH